MKYVKVNKDSSRWTFSSTTSFFVFMSTGEKFQIPETSPSQSISHTSWLASFGVDIIPISTLFSFK